MDSGFVRILRHLLTAARRGNNTGSRELFRLQNTAVLCHDTEKSYGFQWKIETPPPCRVQRQIVKIASAWCERGPSGRLSSGRYALGRMPHSTDPFYREQFHMISLRNENDLRIGMTV